MKTNLKCVMKKYIEFEKRCKDEYHESANSEIYGAFNVSNFPDQNRTNNTSNSNNRQVV